MEELLLGLLWKAIALVAEAVLVHLLQTSGLRALPSIGGSAFVPGGRAG